MFGEKIFSQSFTSDVCVYCCKQPASTTAPIFARGFFLEPMRTEGLRAPACNGCHREKSILEDYVTASLSSKRQHFHRWKSVRKIVSATFVGRASFRARLGTSPVQKNIELDGAILKRLFAFIARALVWFHWNVYLSDERHWIRCFSVIAIPPQLVDELFFGDQTRDQVMKNLGSGRLVYQGTQDLNDPSFTTWRFSLPAGDLTGRPNFGKIYVLTGPKSHT